MKKLLFTIFLIGLWSGVASAKDIYVTQSGAGGNTGADCANARPVSWFNTSGNWGVGSSQISAGDRVHLCGTFTGTAGATMLTIQGNGASGNPITILFEPGAVLTAPYWNGYLGAIYCSGHDYITIDGGGNGTATNTNGAGTGGGSIQNTDDGTALGNQQVTRAIVFTGCGNSTIRNLTIHNMYMRTQDSNDSVDSVGIDDSGASNVRITHNSIDHIRAGSAWGAGSSPTAHGEFDNNYFNFVEVPIVSATGGVPMDDLKIHHNDFAGNAHVWDCATNCWHHEAIHLFSQPTINALTHIQIYDNYFHGLWSQNTDHITTAFYMEQTGPGTLVYNNVFDWTAGNINNQPANGTIDCKGAGSNNCIVYNNTIISQNHWGTPFAGTAENSGHVFTNNIVISSSGPDCGGGCTSADYNVYYDVANGDFMGFRTFAQWQALGFDANGHNAINPSVNAGNSYVPPSGSIALGNAANLTASSVAALNSDKNGTPRPGGSTPWDVGALQGNQTSSATRPSPPTNLTVAVQ